MSEPTATGLYAQMELAPGSLLAGRFRIEGLIGVGGMGVVYRARDEALDVPVAIKLLRPELAMRADAFERFRQELLLARQVSSPHVVRIHDIARHDFGDGAPRWLISMDLVSGEPLDHRIERGPLPVDEALRIARQIALGLEAAHARGVVHRDLKPANVLVDADGNAYISDFGVARSLAGSTRSATVGIVGTPDYLSPEQARGDPVGPRSDLYALGLILNEMLTGERAFASATAAEALAQRLVGTPALVTTLRPEVPPWVARLVERLLRPQPSHRLPDAAAVVRAIDERALPRDPATRSRVAIAAGLFALLAFAVAAGTWWWRTHPAPRIPAPAPSRPLERLLLLPLQSDSLPDARRMGLDMHLRQALADVPGLATVDPGRSRQAMGQLGNADAPDLAQAREAAAASRALRLRLARQDTRWMATGELLADDGARTLAGPWSGSPADALRAWLARQGVRDALGLAEPAPLQLPPEAVLDLHGIAGIARDDDHYDAALAALRDATDAAPGDMAGWLWLSEIAQAVGEHEAARSAIASARRAAVRPSARLQRRLQAEQALLEGDAPSAVSHWRAMLERTPADTLAELQLARAQGAGGDFPAAIATLQHLTARDAQDARAWYGLGKFSILQGDARRAVDDYLLRALVLFKRSRDRYGEAEAVNALGIGYGRLGQTAEAEEQFRRAVALRRQAGNRSGVATSLRNLANVLGQRGAFDEAAAALEEARAIEVALDDRAGLAALDNERGLLFEERGDYRAALDAFRSALQGFEYTGDPHGMAEALNNIGFAHYQLGAYDDAQSSWLRAADGYRGLGAHTGVVRTAQNLGLLAIARGRWDEALRRQSQALDEARRQQMAEEMAVGHRNLAELALARGDIGSAIAQADRAVMLFGQREDRRGSIDARLLRIEALIAADASGMAARELAELRRGLADASTEQRAIAGRLAAELALARGDARAAATALHNARPLANASGVRVLQLRLDLLLARLDARSVAAFDAPTAALGNAGLRLEWIEAAMTERLARGDARGAVPLYREATGWLHGATPPVAARLHELGAAALAATGDGAAAGDARAAMRLARDAMQATIPVALRTQRTGRKAA